MNYNELKLLILRTIYECGSMSSEDVVTHLMSKGASVEIHAVRMAMMRYYRHGLLLREKVGGSFSYGLSDRGSRRLDWLGAAQKRNRNAHNT